MEELKVKFDKEYNFEGKKVTEVGLSCYAEFTTSDLCEVNAKWKTAKGNAVLPEFDMLWACYAAAKATDLPVEFFLRLPAKEGKKVLNVGITFFQG